MTLTHIAVASLALWRISWLFTHERGPGDVFLRIRARFGVTHDDSGEPDTWSSNYGSALLTCFWCFSAAMAVPYAALWYLVPGAALWLSVPFAVSAGAIIVGRLANGAR